MVHLRRNNGAHETRVTVLLKTDLGGSAWVDGQTRPLRARVPLGAGMNCRLVGREASAKKWPQPEKIP
jgi:hypothetical protein